MSNNGLKIRQSQAEVSRIISFNTPYFKVVESRFQKIVDSMQIPFQSFLFSCRIVAASVQNHLI